jgi:hypothetical protein
MAPAIHQPKAGTKMKSDSAGVKRDALEDLPVRKDDEQRSNGMIEQAVTQPHSPLRIGRGKANE